MNKLTVLLIFCCFTLQSQDEVWQHFFHLNSNVIETLDVGENIWFITTSAIVKFDKKTKKTEHFSVHNLELNTEILDIAKGKNDRLFVLGDRNSILEYSPGVTNDSDWIRWPTWVLLGWNIDQIYGQTKDGSLLLKAEGNQTLSFSKDETYTHFENNTSVMEYDRYQIIITEDDQLLIWNSYELVFVDEEETVLTFLDLGIPAIHKVKLSEDGDIWIYANRNIWFWSRATNQWFMTEIEAYDWEERMAIHTYTDKKALLISKQRIVSLSFDGVSIIQEELGGQFTEENLPSMTGVVDGNDRYWYLGKRSKNLMYWDRGEEAKEIFHQSWMNVWGINWMSIDKQGVIWGISTKGRCYFSGGRWNVYENLSFPFNPFDFDMTAENELVISSITTPSPSFIPVVATFKWHQGSWLPIGNDGAELNTRFGLGWGGSEEARVDLEIDQQQNIWNLWNLDTSFFVYTRGKWLEFFMRDMLLNANVFTCLSEAPDGKMWIGTDNGIAIYDGFAFEYIDGSTLHLDNLDLFEGNIEDIAFDDKGYAWVLTRKRLLRWNGEEWKAYVVGEELPALLVLKEIIQGNNDEMWISSEESGVLHFEGSGWEILTPENSGLIENSVIDMIRDYDGRIWFSQKNNVSVLHPTEKLIRPFAIEEGQNLGVYPNPGCCLYQIHWRLDKKTSCELKLINAQGQVLRNWSFDQRPAGDYQIEMKQGNLSSGNYFIHLSIGDKTVETIPLIVVNY